MKRLFPEMYNRPSNGMVFVMFVCWLVVFVFIPLWIPLLCDGLWNNLAAISWIECLYHGFNGILLAMLLKDHLMDTFFDVQLNVKGFIRTVAITVGLMVLWYIICQEFISRLPGLELIALDAFPLSEMQVTITTGYLITNNPIAGTICMTLFTPFAFCGLFYANTFAPLCCWRRWLAYPLTAVVLLLPVLFENLWWEVDLYLWICYLVALPIHMLACWSYQRSDGPWAPIVSLGIFNLLCSLPLALL